MSRPLAPKVYTVCMAAPYSELPRWLLVLLVAPACFFGGALMFGFYPKNPRQWRLLGLGTAAFTIICVVAIGVFHYA